MTPKPIIPYQKVRRLPKIANMESPMTIGIGVLCSTRPKVKAGTPNPPVRPDALVLVADTMGSLETDSCDELHKMYFERDARFYSTAAGVIEMAAELMPMFIANLQNLPRRSHGTISEALNIAVHGHRVQHFTWDVLAQRHSFLRTERAGMLPVVTSDENNILQEWQEYDTGTQLIVGTFDDSGQSFLYIVGKQYDNNGAAVPGMVKIQEFPGHSTIGTGSYNASFWLNYRNQTLGRNIRQSAYHAYEAKVMAARAPTVNDNIEIIIATAEQGWYLSKDNPEAPGCEVSLLELEAMFKKYGPQNTTDLGHKSRPQSASRKSAGMQ